MLKNLLLGDYMVTPRGVMPSLFRHLFPLSGFTVFPPDQLHKKPSLLNSKYTNSPLRMV